MTVPELKASNYGNQVTVIDDSDEDGPIQAGARRRKRAVVPSGHLIAPKRECEIVDLTEDEDDGFQSTSSRKKSRSCSETSSSPVSPPHQALNVTRKPAAPSTTHLRPGELVCVLLPAPSAADVRSVTPNFPGINGDYTNGHTTITTAPDQPIKASIPSNNHHSTNFTVPDGPTAKQQAHRQQFTSNLKVLNKIALVNDVDHDTPPLDFCFIGDSVLGEGVERATEEVMLGCDCHKRRKQKLGCVYLECTCIQDLDLAHGGEHDQKRAFPYGASASNHKCLSKIYLQTGSHIYECNARCDCGPECKNRVVQFGRHVGLEIFKTEDGKRGWGLRCTEDLRQGEFIDTYRGEIITSAEADQRGKSDPEGADIYFFDLDKFAGNADYDESRAYVVDGRPMGGPTRFMNHSCDPNCQMHTVSYNHNDRNVYELAFFACEEIPAGTELTFDYDPESASDLNNAETKEYLQQSQEKQQDIFAEKKGYRQPKCLCGSALCRGWIFA